MKQNGTRSGPGRELGSPQSEGREMTLDGDGFWGLAGPAPTRLACDETTPGLTHLMTARAGSAGTHSTRPGLQACVESCVLSRAATMQPSSLAAQSPHGRQAQHSSGCIGVGTHQVMQAGDQQAELDALPCPRLPWH